MNTIRPPELAGVLEPPDFPRYLTRPRQGRAAPTLQAQIGQCLGQARVREAGIDRGTCLRVRGAADVAHDDQIKFFAAKLDMFNFKTLTGK